MVAIKSSSGGFVQVEIKNIPKAILDILAKGKQIINGTDAKVFQAAHFLGEEIQESIMGNRMEEKSVDTGNFANSIKVDKKKELEYSVETDVEYAKFLEYGTSKMAPRPHFRNSLKNNREKIIEIIKKI